MIGWLRLGPVRLSLPAWWTRNPNTNTEHFFMDRFDNGMSYAIFAALGFRHVELSHLVKLIRDPTPRLRRFMLCHEGLATVKVLGDRLSNDIMGSVSNSEDRRVGKACSRTCK